jgi:threonine synthase
MGLEIAEQFGWELPDLILYPPGGGVGIIGIHKALLELREIGWISDYAVFPRLVVVQANGCAPIVKAWKQNRLESDFWPDSKTCAFGLNVPKALGDFLILEAVYKTKGCAVGVDDEDILCAQKSLASYEGAFVWPEGAAILAAAIKLLKEGWIKAKEKVVLLNTGTGLKYPETVQAQHPLVQPDNDIEAKRQ